MAEEQGKDIQVAKALLDLGRQTKEIDIAGIKVTIRALKWFEERDIADVIGKMEQAGKPSQVYEREYMKLVALYGLVKPKYDELEIEKLVLSTVSTIAREILDFTGGISKKS